MFWMITTKFCTCINSTAVVACAKMCCSMITRIWLTAIIFYIILIVIEKLLVKQIGHMKLGPTEATSRNPEEQPDKFQLNHTIKQDWNQFRWEWVNHHLFKQQWNEIRLHAQFWCLNSLWPSDARWWQRSGSTMAHVMACCLTAPSHYLNQCWLIISEIQ